MDEKTKKLIEDLVEKEKDIVEKADKAIHEIMDKEDKSPEDQVLLSKLNCVRDCAFHTVEDLGNVERDVALIMINGGEYHGLY